MPKTANSTANDKTEEKVKVAILLNVMGKEAIEIFNNSSRLDKDQKKAVIDKSEKEHYL